MKSKSKTAKGNQKFFNLVKNYKKLGAKEFFKKWGKGIEGITALQIARGNLIGIVPVIIGTIIGIVVVALSKTWWLLLILIGGFIVSLMQLLGFLQKFIRLKVQDKLMKMIEEKNKEVLVNETPN